MLPSEEAERIAEEIRQGDIRVFQNDVERALAEEREELDAD